MQTVRVNALLKRTKGWRCRPYAVMALRGAAAMVFVPTAGRAANDCTGTECLTILDVRVGTRCGKAASVEADFRNDSDQHLRGYIVFTLPGGQKRFEPTGFMAPGEKGNQYVCAGTGEVSKVANTDASPSYPPEK